MAATIRVTGVTEEQATTVLEEVTGRGFAGAATTPNVEDGERFDISIGLEKDDDVSALASWLKEQSIDSEIRTDEEQ